MYSTPLVCVAQCLNSFVAKTGYVIRKAEDHSTKSVEKRPILRICPICFLVRVSSSSMRWHFFQLLCQRPMFGRFLSLRQKYILQAFLETLGYTLYKIDQVQTNYRKAANP